MAGSVKKMVQVAVLEAVGTMKKPQHVKVLTVTIDQVKVKIALVLIERGRNVNHTTLRRGGDPGEILSLHSDSHPM